MRSKTTFYLFFAFILWIYNVIKATQVPFYWDEIYTYLRYVKPGVFLIKDYDKMDANHHLLFTWIVQAFVKTFGLHEFVLRLPSILSFIIYAFFSVRFSITFKSILFQFGCLIILLLNPFVNDYFCLARGYALSMALMLGSLYFVFQFIQENLKHRFAFAALIFASLSLLANFIMINYVLVLLMMYLLYVLITLKNEKQKINILYKAVLSLIAPIAVLVFTIPIILNLKNAGALFIGKNNGFWQDTIQSLILRFLYNADVKYWEQLLIEIGLVLVLFIGLILIMSAIMHKTFTIFLKFQLAIMFVLFSCVMLNIFQNKFMHVLYGFGRTAMYYYPLLSLASIFILYNLSLIKPIMAKRIFALVMLVFAANFTLNANVDYAIEKRAEGDAKLMVEDLTQFYLSESKKQKAITLGMSFPYHDDLTFYKETRHLPWLNYVQDEFAFHLQNDFFFIALKDTIYLKNISFKILYTYEVSQASLIQNLQKWKLKKSLFDTLNFEKFSSNSFEIAGKKGVKIDSLNAFSETITINIKDSLLKAPSKLNRK